MTKATKKTHRSVVSRILQGIGILVLVVVMGLGLGYTFWFRPAVREMPVLERDYLAQWQGTEVAGDESEHAWPVMVRAVEELGQLPTNAVTLGGGRVVQNEIHRDLRPGDADWDRLRAYLEKPETNVAMDRLREVTGKPVLGYPHTNDTEASLIAAQASVSADFDGYEPLPSEHPSMHSLILSYFSVAGNHSRQLLSRVYLRGLGESRTANESVLDLEAAFALARHLERQRSGLAARFSSDLVARVGDTVLEVLARDAELIQPEVMESLDEAFAAWQGRDRINPFGYAVLSGRDLLQRVYNEDGDMTGIGVARLLEGELGMMGDTSLMSRVDEGLGEQALWVQAYSVFARGGYPGRAELEALIEEFVPIGEAFGSLNPWEIDPRQEPMKGVYRTARAFEGYEEMPTQLAYAHSIASKITGSGCVAVSRVSAVRLAIAAIRYRSETGDWARSADELGGGSAWPDGFTGEPLRMIMNDGGPVIYSAGTDRNDDGGRECEKPIHFWWPNLIAEMEESRPAVYDGDWVLWTASLHEDRVAERVAAAAELEED